MCYNTYSRKYYLDYEFIISDTYKTIDIDTLINNNPRDTIKYINDLKLKHGINYIRVKFNNPVSNSDKMALSSEYRNDKTVTLEFFSQEREIQRKAEEKIYNGSFWCAGISELRTGNECYDAGQDVEKFLEIARLLINNKWLYFDENWNRIEKPEF